VVRPLRKVSESVPHMASVKKVKKPTPAMRVVGEMESSNCSGDK